LKELKDKRAIAVSVYFEKKGEQVASAAAVILADSDAKTTAATTKTAEGIHTTAEDADDLADHKMNVAFKNFSDHWLSGKAKTDHLKGVELSKAHSSASILAGTAKATLIAADTAYGAAKALSDAAATRAATAKTTASAAVSATSNARAAALDAHKAFVDGVDASHKAGKSY